MKEKGQTQINPPGKQKKILWILKNRIINICCNNMHISNGLFKMAQ